MEFARQTARSDLDGATRLLHYLLCKGSLLFDTLGVPLLLFKEFKARIQGPLNERTRILGGQSPKTDNLIATKRYKV